VRVDERLGHLDAQPADEVDEVDEAVEVDDGEPVKPHPCEGGDGLATARQPRFLPPGNWSGWLSAQTHRPLRIWGKQWQSKASADSAGSGTF
jgi:hypothetical protein